jgi:tetratricopeptide (TPR) repeat protein
MKRRASRRNGQSGRLAAIAAALVLLTVAAYGGVLRSAFVNYDDDVYVTGNAEVLRGLDGASIVWAATATHASNWHPVTWLSHMLDVELFGLDSGKHHATSLLLHAANVVLLFLLFVRMTGAVWRSALVAALFAVHPLHVESVAWIAERKDVLSTFLWLLTSAAWLRYLAAPAASRYVVVLAAFALGLMAKPMLVTLPFTLLLLDAWPLRRRERGWRALLVEKAPLFAMAALSCVATLVAQRRGGAVQALADFTFAERLANALTSYVAYLGRAAWPSSLAVFYPHGHEHLLAWSVAWAALLLAAGTAAALSRAKRAPYLAFGWLWYVGTLVPVIGLVQVGGQGMADRYTYVPLIGVFVAVAWGLAEAVGESAARRRVAVVAAIAAVGALALVTRAQVGTWRDSTALFERALSVTTGNWLAENNLGRALSDAGRVDDAIAHFERALRIAPDYVGAHLNLGNALVSTGRVDEGIDRYRRALALRPDFAEARGNLGAALLARGEAGQAVAEYEQAVRASPGSLKLANGLGVALARAGRFEEAVAAYRRALQLDPQSSDALNNLGLALARMSRSDEAIATFREAIRLRPGNAEAHNNLGVALANARRIREALAEFEQAVRIQPAYREARANLEAARAAVASGR